MQPTLKGVSFFSLLLSFKPTTLKTQKIIYWIATGLFCAIMMYSAGLYFTQTDMVKGFFESFGYPTDIVIPLAVAKVLGVIMILWRKSAWLTSWAYAGFFFDLVFAFFAHHFSADFQDTTFVLVAMIFLLISFFFGKTVRA